MDSLLLQYYNRELQHIREMGSEFAREFPKIAGRLGLDSFECSDPYVERLLEGFSFLAARIQLKLDAEFPRFTQHLLEMIYPEYLTPTPSMAVVRLQPDLTEGSLAEGFTVPRHSSLFSVLGKNEQTSCEYRTAHDVTLWPLEIIQAEYIGATTALDAPEIRKARAGVRLRLRATAGLKFDQLTMNDLTVYLHGHDDVPMRLYEQMRGNSLGIMIRPTSRPAPWREIIPRDSINTVGFDNDQALLPQGPRSFSGYRLLREYFSLHQRFMFLNLAGLRPALQRCSDNEVDLLVLLDRSEPFLENNVNKTNFDLFCTPAINMFPKRADRVHLTEESHEYHVVPDRTRPMDFEVYHVKGVVGHGTGSAQEQEFLPFYSTNDLTRRMDEGAYFSIRRERRLMSSVQRRQGARSSYLGSETYITLVDASEAPFSSDLRQLALTTLCTNRDLPLLMSVGKGTTDFNMESGAPVASVRCVAGPTRPRPSLAYGEGEASWRLISHLSLNYLSIIDTNEDEGAAALRELLSLYGDSSEGLIRKQIEGVRSISSKGVTRRVPMPGPITFGRGLEITVTFDETQFEGTGVFLLASVLEQFFARYVSINTFTETVARTTERGEIMRWPVRIGRRHTL
ncbi:MAG: type VI secretion system baseplate subunit TssF [Gammaproteobacteria bacterium]|nr:type VI secretion system baseplate subunit TssF [Gammaproteobacteria bacterium]